MRVREFQFQKQSAVSALLSWPLEARRRVWHSILVPGVVLINYIDTLVRFWFLFYDRSLLLSGCSLLLSCRRFLISLVCTWPPQGRSRLLLRLKSSRKQLCQAVVFLHCNSVGGSSACIPAELCKHRKPTQLFHILGELFYVAHAELTHRKLILSNNWFWVSHRLTNLRRGMVWKLLLTVRNDFNRRCHHFQYFQGTQTNPS